MRNIRLTILVSIIAALSGCAAPIRVASDYDPNANFGALKTYGWAPVIKQQAADPRLTDGLLNDRIHAAIDREMAAKGFTKSDRPDFLVTYHLGLENKLDVSTLHRSYPYYAGYGAWGGYSETYVREYEEGTFLLDIIDPKSEQLIWRGSSQSEVRNIKTPEKRTERINAIVAKLLEKFPPQPK